MINPILQGLASSTSTNARSSSEPTGSWLTLFFFFC
jgi:hypothetical protein